MAFRVSGLRRTHYKPEERTMSSDTAKTSNEHDPQKKPPVTHEPSEPPKHKKDEKLDQALEDSFPASDPVSP